MCFVSQFPGEDDVAVEDSADGVGDGVVGVVAFDEDGVEGGDAALIGLATAFEESGEEGEDAGGVASGGGRFPGGEADLALGEREAGDAIHHQEDVAAGVAKGFGDGGAGVGGAESEERGFIAGGDDDDAAGETFGA